MAISTIHRLDKITGPLALSELTQMKWSAGIKSMIEYPAGHTHPFFRANQDEQPELSCHGLKSVQLFLSVIESIAEYNLSLFTF